MKPIHTLTVNGEAYDLQDDRLDRGFTKLGAFSMQEDGIQLISLTQNQQTGETFACREFLIYMTLPTNDDIINNYKTQLYIGHEPWKNWDVFIPQGFSRTGTRRIRLHLQHAFDGFWIADGVYTDNIDQLTCAVPNVGVTGAFGNLYSTAAAGKTLSQLHFYAQSAFDTGTVIEIYGK